MNLEWIDYTRRSDPACPAGVDRFEEQLFFHGYPKVLCFWTKAPATLAELYHKEIVDLQQHGTLVLAQVTVNGYGKDMEPGVTPAMQDSGPLIALISSGAVRLRFDPIIAGYTTPQHFLDCLSLARDHNISRITVNFLVPEYKGVGKLLQSKGFNIKEPTPEWRMQVLKSLHPYIASTKVELAICAETAGMLEKLPWLKPAACADPEWAIALQPDLKGVFTHTGRGSRPGCGCVYSGDWGRYRNQGGYACPHSCLYCYAK